jgi:hypothetical protein
MLGMLHTFHAACVDADVERQYIVISASWTWKTSVPWDASCEQILTRATPCKARGSFKRVVLTSLAMASLDATVPRAHEEDHKEDSDFRENIFYLIKHFFWHYCHVRRPYPSRRKVKMDRGACEFVRPQYLFSCNFVKAQGHKFVQSLYEVQNKTIHYLASGLSS